MREIISLSPETSPSSKISNAKNGGEERWRDIIYEGRRHIAAQRFHRKARARAVDTPVYYVLAAFIQQKRAFRRRNCKFPTNVQPFPISSPTLTFQKTELFYRETRNIFQDIFVPTNASDFYFLFSLLLGYINFSEFNNDL